MSDTTSTTNETGYSKQVVVGILAVAGASMASKLGSFIAQLLLGWWLLERDFELWAMACVANVFVAGLRDGGTGRIIVQGGLSALDKIRSVAQFCFVANLFASLLLISIAPLIASYFDDQEIIEIIPLMALAIGISSPLTVGRARMALHMRFKEAAFIDGLISIGNYLLMVVLAYVGFGAKSFVIPQISTNLLGALVYRRMLGPLPVGADLNWSRLKEIIQAARWLIIAAFASSLAMMGDYMIIGRFAKPVLAHYFFGFQLTLSVSMVFSPAMQKVLLPTFTRIRSDAGRQRAAFERAVRLFALASALTCCLVAVLAEPLVELVWWNGKWNQAIPVIEIMSFSLMLRLLNPLSYSVMQSEGKWSVYAGFLILESVMVLVASLIGTSIGGLLAITLCIGGFRCVFPLLATYRATKYVGHSGKAIFIILLRRIGTVSLVALAILVTSRSFPVTSPILDLARRIGLLGVVYCLLLATVFRPDFAELRSLVRRIRKSPGKIADL